MTQCRFTGALTYGVVELTDATEVEVLIDEPVTVGDPAGVAPRSGALPVHIFAAEDPASRDVAIEGVA